MTNDLRAGEEDVTPRPSALIESLRSFGYSPATSVADLIDNSLSAEATRIDVMFNWAGPASWVSIADNGNGMTAAELRDAMRPGSSNPLDDRAEKDLGRFGLGLKTASFAQARSLAVVSKRNGRASIRVWDLDHVQKRNRWVLLDSSPNENEIRSSLPSGDGTVVAWHSMDRLVDERPASDPAAKRAFFRMVDEVRQHLEMVFHRFISDGIELFVNSQSCIAWDPFLEHHSRTEKLPDDSIPVVVRNGHSQTLRIQPFVLPHKSQLDADEHRRAAGPRGWNMQQGFYLYRAKRLIVAGDWFDRGTKPEEHHKLARIRVEITQEMDELWALDVKKSRARPPANLQSDFQRIARATRERAEAVYRTRGRRSVGQGGRRFKVTPVWRVESDGTTVSYSINREHPILRSLLERLTPAQESRSLLKLVEKNLPIANILSQGYSDEQRLSDEPDIDDDVRRAARELFCHLVTIGSTADQARQVLKQAQPFERAIAFVEALEECDCK